MEQKRLYKSRDRKLAGVCGGVAEYLNIDPTIVRILTVVFSLIWGSGLVVYIVAAVCMPEPPQNPQDQQNQQGQQTPPQDPPQA